ncbi:MAG: AbrB/MazE/SpoVT family DNA-binding domain-containing protein [Candidatus Omnitrophica bacterium]|nr:AbrB/MazE/SpoVT family DNA-binding domain-containing protein [Candidatus Omnitrophota bacterium]
MRFIRKINRIAKRSYGVVIPMEFIKKLNWSERQKIVLSLRGKTITIKDWKP